MIGKLNNIWWFGFALISLGLATQVAAAESTVCTEVLITRLDDALWQADYRFSEPVEGFVVYPADLSFRAHAWQLSTPGVRIEERNEGGYLLADEPFETLSLRFGSYAEFDPKTYVPVMTFSDGGAAVYSGHFSGDVLIDGEPQASPTTFRLAGRADEHLLLPAWTSDTQPVYFYAGPEQPLEADQVVLIADPQMPPWLQDTFRKAVPAATTIFSQRLDFRLDDKPLVLIAAGELEDFEGYSVKGGGLDGQFTIMLRGTGLLEPSIERRRMFEKMVAHKKTAGRCRRFFVQS